MTVQQFKSFVSLLRKQYIPNTGIVVYLTGRSPRGLTLTGSCVTNPENAVMLVEVILWADEDIIYQGGLSRELLTAINKFKPCRFEVTTAAAEGRGSRGEVYCIRSKEECKNDKCKYKEIPKTEVDGFFKAQRVPKEKEPWRED